MVKFNAVDIEKTYNNLDKDETAERDIQIIKNFGGGCKRSYQRILM